MNIEIVNEYSMSEVIKDWQDKTTNLMAQIITTMICVGIAGLAFACIWAIIVGSFYPLGILILALIIGVLVVLIISKMEAKLEKDYKESLVLFNTAYVDRIRVKKNRVYFYFSKDKNSDVKLIRSFPCFKCEYVEDMDQNQVKVDYQAFRISISGLYLLDHNGDLSEKSLWFDE